MAQNKKSKSNAATAKKNALNEKLLLAQYQRDMQSAFNQGLSNGYGTAVLIMMWLLHTEHGFGKKRLALFMRKINDFCLGYVAMSEDGPIQPKEGEFDGVSLKDIADQLGEECGVYIDTDTWVMSFDGIEIMQK